MRLISELLCVCDLFSDADFAWVESEFDKQKKFKYNSPRKEEEEFED